VTRQAGPCVPGGVVQAARLRVAVKDRQHDPTSVVTHRIAGGRTTAGSGDSNRSGVASPTDPSPGR